MNSQIQTSKVKVIQCGSNLAYVLTNNEEFLPTEYKVLQSQDKNVFIECVKATYNGKVELYYLSAGFKPLSGILKSLDAGRFVMLVANLLEAISEVKNNGFLSCPNIDVCFDRIFVDTSSFKVRLIYLPLISGALGDYNVFENDLRSEIEKHVRQFPGLESPSLKRFESLLFEGRLTLEELSQQIIMRGDTSRETVYNPVPPRVPEPEKRPQKKQGLFSRQRAKLVAMNAPTPEELNIAKSPFVIGRKPGVDGLITFNGAIGRTHCEVSKLANGAFTVTDLGSTNGTYVNREKLQPHQPHSLNHGDILRLANSDFRFIVS